MSSGAGQEEQSEPPRAEMAGTDESTLIAMLCDGASCACSNGIDDDEDLLIDAEDPECTGPLDNDESSFATGISGDNRDPRWQDCFYDGNSGAGDDRCRYATDCQLGILDSSDPACQVGQNCIDFCQPRTPNGCDCFGCCTVRDQNQVEHTILIGSDCSLDQINDQTSCPRCEKSTQCDNPCGTCELCLGKQPEDLPDECRSQTTPSDNQDPDRSEMVPNDQGGSTPPSTDQELFYTCDDGPAICGPNLPECPAGNTCTLGCCLLTSE